MFRKPFTVKSNVNMRNSERNRRKLLAHVPNVGSAMSSKATVAVLKIKRNDGDIVNVYTFDKEPMLFELAEHGTLFPTVYFVWKMPNTFPVLFINEEVLTFLSNGADLMLPGVLRKQGEFPEFGRYTPVAISVISQSEIIGPVAIGQSLMSSMEMIASGMQGRGVSILHTSSDYLWKLGSRVQPLRIAVVLPVLENTIPSNEEFPALYSPEIDSGMKFVVPAANSRENRQEQVINIEQECVKGRSDSPIAETMESLLERCFLAALKYRVTKKAQLPLDVGQFYSQYLLSCVPNNRRIDPKKTEYKKFANFLSFINDTPNGPIIKLVSKQKGSDAIIEVNWEHPALKHFIATDEKIIDESACGKKSVSVDVWYAVTEPAAPLFRSAGFNKGQLLEPAQIREIVTHYVKSRGLSEKNKVNMNDDFLKTLLKSNGTLEWNTMFQKIQSKMTKTYVITTCDGRQIVRKTDLPKITFKMENRAGNKKVTLINNLATFGIDSGSFCRKIQIGVAASANIVNDVPQCDGPQVQVQGNQVLFVSELLTSEYGVANKYMSGLELIPKKKK